MSKRGRPSTTEEALWELRLAGRRLLTVVATDLGIPRLVDLLVRVIGVVRGRWKRGGR